MKISYECIGSGWGWRYIIQILPLTFNGYDNPRPTECYWIVPGTYVA